MFDFDEDMINLTADELELEEEFADDNYSDFIERQYVHEQERWYNE